MDESDDAQVSDWPKGLIVKVAVSIAIANYSRSNSCEVLRCEEWTFALYSRRDHQCRQARFAIWQRS